MDFSKCPICAMKLKTAQDVDEGRVYEWEEICDNCGMYEDRFEYGNRLVRWGLLVSTWAWDEERPPRDLWENDLEEAKVIYQSPTGRLLINKHFREETDWVDKSVFADWCAENGFSRHEQVLRQWSDYDREREDREREKRTTGGNSE